MQVKISSDEKFVRYSSCKRKESVNISEKIRKRHSFASFGGSWRRTIDIENSKIGAEELKSDR